MSLLSDFVSSLSSISQTIIGAEIISIGGGAEMSGTLNEDAHSRDYETGGFEVTSSMSFVVGTSFFVAAYPLPVISYIGKTATAREQTWRVESISRGSFFVTVTLQSVNKSA